MEAALGMIAVSLFWMLIFKDMSGKEELRKIRQELEKLRKGDKT